MLAYVFPGQGAQFEGMGKDMYDTNPETRNHFEKANEILGYRLTDVMFEGSAEELKETKITQPALFIHALAAYFANAEKKANAVAGHSLGEFSALVACGALSYEDGLKLVYERAMAMQDACNDSPGTMAAILGLDNEVVEGVCDAIDEVVVAANYNCPGQVVISGSITGIDKACESAKEKGAKRALKLPVGGAFHSPLMASAKDRLENAINAIQFNEPNCPIYQNVTAAATKDPVLIKQNLINQLTGPVKWTQIIQNMIADGVTDFIECGGNGKVLQGLIKKVDRSVQTTSI
jgi:[acyl-carrier-protein] S-malonyltransferase